MTLVAAPLVSVIGGAICLMMGRRSRWIAAFTWAISTGLVAYWIGVVARLGPVHETLGGWDSVGISLVMDRPAVAFLLIEQLLTGAVLAYSWRSELRSAFYALFLVLAGAVTALCMSVDMFNIYVLLELLTLTSFLLVAYERRPVQIWASLKYLLLASLGMSIYLFGVALVYAHTGSLGLQQVGDHLASLTAVEAGWIPVAASLITAGIAVKAGVFLYSLWLPAAHGSASAGVSALLSGLVIKMGVLALLRFSFILPIQHALTVLGVMTGLMGALYAIVETDAKKMLAFSTLSQVGYLLIGIGAGSEASRVGVLMYVVAHGMFKGLLFLAVGDAGQRLGSTELSVLRARRHEIPAATRAALLVGCAAIAGFPFVGGFWAKEWLLQGSPPLQQALLWLLMFCTTVVFSKLLPAGLARGRGGGVRHGGIPYVMLGAGMPLVFMLSRILAPGQATGTADATLVQAGWSLGVVAVGTFVGVKFRVLQRMRVPRSVFRIEESVLVMLFGVFVVLAVVLVTSP